MIALHTDQAQALLEAAGPSLKFYLVGAGGCGMSGLAHLLLDRGWQVAGSDLAVNAEVAALQARGARIGRGHDAGRLAAEQPDVVVYSSAVRQDNPELQMAERLRLPIVRRAVMLAALQRRYCGVCVAGMHGKTTTTALLAFALENLSAQPGYAVGALVPQLPRPARLSPRTPQTDPGPGELLVLEADESDGTLSE